MTDYRVLKVQTPALRLRSRIGRGDVWFGAHNFVAVVDPSGVVICELHGIARGPGGAQLRIYGGLLPFRHEVIWGERFDHRTGFYDPAFPQGVLTSGDKAAIDVLLRRADAVRAAVNDLQIRYPWPAAFGDNSNAYYATLIAGMGLADVHVDRQLWAPSVQKRLLDEARLHQISGLGTVQS